MADLQSLVIAGIIAFAVSALVNLFTYFSIERHRYKTAEKRKILADRLEKLYTPLFTFIQTAKQVPARMTDKQLLTFAIGEPERDSFDEAIEHYYYSQTKN